MAIAAAAGSTRTPSPAPTSDRGRRRLAAEEDWRRFADRRAVDVFRLAGIYGPGRSAFDDLRAGTARRISKPGHAFGRIHRDDIVRAVLAAMRQDRASGARVLNLVDDEPAESADVVAEAARLLGVAAPEAVPFERALAAMTPDGAQLLGGEPQGVRPADAAGARPALAAIRAIARDYAPSWPRSGASVRRSSARSCGRDRR